MLSPIYRAFQFPAGFIDGASSFLTETRNIHNQDLEKILGYVDEQDAVSKSLSMSGFFMPEGIRDVYAESAFRDLAAEINSRADTLPLMSPEVRPWPVTPPPPVEEVMAVYGKRRAAEFGKWCEDNLRFEYSFGKAEALQGLKVICMGIWRLGNKFASSLLAEAGAEVINIEPPEGDPLRKLRSMPLSCAQ